MERNHYSRELKEKAVQMYLNGKSSIQIAKELGLSSPDLVRKWVQFWRKENNVPATNYRRKDITEEINSNMKLLNKIERIEYQRDNLLQTLKLVCTGSIEGWEELLSYLETKN